jgi:hypothetical protein
MNERDRIDKGNHKKEEPFYAGQGRILDMIATSAPLADILTRIVLLMETQRLSRFRKPQHRLTNR